MRYPILCILCMAFFSVYAQYTENSAGLNNPGMEGGPTEFEFADINYDGHLDILCIGDHGSPYINTNQHGVMVWLGNSNFGWTLIQYGNFGYGGLAVGDVNNDGYLDVGYGMHHNYNSGDLGDQVLEVALGDATGSNWIPWDDSLGLNGQDWGMFGTDFADVNNDGWLDIGSVSFGCCDGVHVHLNNHDGTWPHSFGFLGGNSDQLFRFGDVNRDGYADIATAHQYGTVYFGDGTGNFVLTDNNLPSVGILGRSGTSLGDVNNDGGMDLAYINPAGGIEVWAWDEASQLWISLSGNLPVSGNYRITELRDLNMDGFCDLAVAGTGAITTWLGNGDNTWTLNSTNTLPSPGYIKAFRAGGDVDHNGRPDMIVLSNEGSLFTYTNYIRLFREDSPANDLTIKPVFPKGGEVFREGSIWTAEWITEVPQGMNPSIRIELSITGPAGPWTILADNLPNFNRYQMTVPVANSTDCYLRYTATDISTNAVTVTSSPFTIIGTPVDQADPPAPELSFSLFPNPASDRCDIILAAAEGGEAHLTLFDLQGRSLGTVKRTLHPGKNPLRIPLSDFCRPALPPGCYQVVLRTANAMARKSLVLVR